MKKYRRLLVYAVAVSLLAPSPAGAWPLLLAPPEAVPADRSGCADGREAARRYQAGEYAEAAALYEGCARATGEVGYWRKAGMARYSAKQYAHAIQALGGYPGAATGAEEDRPILAMLADAQAQAVRVRFGVAAAAGAPRPEALRLVPRTGDAQRDAITVAWSPSTVALDVWLDPGAWSAALVLAGDGRVGPQDVTVARDGETAQQVLFRVEAPALPEAPVSVQAPVRVTVEVGPAAARRHEVEVSWVGPPAMARRTRAARTQWDLVPGTWSLRVKARRFAVEERAVTVVGPTTIAVGLTRTREDRARIGLAAGAGAVGLGLLVGGLAGAIGGSRDYKAAVGRLDATDDRTATLSAALTGIQHTSTGTIVATSGVGAGIAAASVAFEANDRLLGVEAGVGAALLITGVAWLIPASRRYARDSEERPEGWTADQAFIDDHRGPELAASALLGLGTGLLAGAGVALIVRAALRGRRPTRKVSSASMSTPRSIGLSLRVSF